MKKIICVVFSALLVLGSVGFAFADTDVVSPMRVGENVQLNVPLYQQQKNYTCGPACIRMALKKFGYSVSESTIESKSGTTESAGTYVYRVVQTLNSYLGNKYAYYTTSGTNFDDKLLTSLRAGYPVICHVKPRVLPNYKNQRVPEGHYVIVTGHILQTGATTQISIQYNDPNWNSKIYGSYSTTIPAMKQAINERAGYYISY